MITPVLQETLGCWSDAPIGATRQLPPRINVASNFIDYRIVVIGFEFQCSLRRSALSLGLRNRDEEFRRPPAGNRQQIERLPMFIKRMMGDWLRIRRIEN